MRRRYLLGSLLWIGGLQYFIVEFVTQQAWAPVPYTLRFNTISDLGATVCGTVPVIGTFACSPLHPLMNFSFILSGGLVVVGMYLLRPLFPKDWTVSLASLLIMIGAFGGLLIGFFPENEHPVPHLIGAMMLFSLANVGMLLLGLALRAHAWRPRYAAFTAVSGAIGLGAFILLPLGLIPFIGIGVIERLVAYPITLWVIASGVFFLRMRAHSEERP